MSADVLDQRERDRGDRFIGQGRGVGATVHDFLIYDVEVDTSALAASDAAAVVLSALQSRF